MNLKGHVIMMPMTRENIEILLDSPDETKYVVSAFADLTVKDGFRNFFDQDFRNQAKAVAAALPEAAARDVLDANLDEVRKAVREEVDPSAKGVAVFVSVPRGLRHVRALNFPVENHLVIDEAPFVLPLLERWHSEPSYLVVLLDSDRAQIFEAHHGLVDEVREVERPDINDDLQRDKPRFTYKKRFAQAFHERLQGAEQDKFLREVADDLDRHWKQGEFHGLILLGPPTILGAMRQLLAKDLANAIAEEANLPTTANFDDVAAEVARVVERWHADRDESIMAELQQRWKENHLVGSGPTEVLDALQQGRANQVICGWRREIPGATCRDCGYRFGAPTATCPYCSGACRSVNALQEILMMALRHRTPVHFIRRGAGQDPLESAGGVAALLYAEANWGPDKATAEASQGGNS